MEFAIVAPVLFLVLFASLEVGFMMMADAALERTASQVTRHARIDLRGSCTNSLKSAIQDGLAGWAKPNSVQVSAQVLYASDPVNFPQTPNSCGGPKDMVQYRISFTQPMFIGMLGFMGIDPFTYQRTVIVQNEP
ncbi:TadE/TadG family type IV pilus assembly protein [Castellaniella hirudinis]|uniref:TadE/TadG family type IV pilus assembly protein n=1 Tax=Castellaniella hirudinis TaxID=1144617 RepID=UPI0039C0F713